MENKTNNKFPSKVLNRLSVPNVVIVGGTASGKSTVGYQLSKVLDFGFLDLDALIEKDTGKPIVDIFKESGENGFRDAESKVIGGLQSIRNHVIVTGAGAIEGEENWTILRKLGAVVWLATPSSEVARRLAMKHSELSKRPLLAESVNIEDKEERIKFLVSKLDELLERRSHRYQESHLSLSCSFVTAETCAHFIKKKLLQESFDL